MTGAAGLLMLPLLAVLIVGTGLPVWNLLVGVATLFAGIGWAGGVFGFSVLNAASARTLGLLESDILQALPLFVLTGVLLERLAVADALYATLGALFGRARAGASFAALGVGALLSPLSGSVASSATLMTRLAGPRLGGLDAGGTTALVSAAATVGVVVPPSLVLILLGDAMLRAHTEASNLPAYQLGERRIIGSHDVFHAALLPAAAVLLFWLLVAGWRGRGLARPPVPARVSRFKGALSVVATVGALALLGGVYLGRVFVVEAAATAALLLLCTGLATRALTRAQWRQVMADTLSRSGALLALLVGATAFSLVFRLWGADAAVTSAVLASPLPPWLTALGLLVLLCACAWVLDALEMIFVIVPIVAPLLVVLLDDAQQVAVLLLLLLQLSFLIPPMGYAVMVARATTGSAGESAGRTLRHVAPFLVAQCLVTLVVFIVPATVHQLDEAAAMKRQAPVLSDDEVEQRMRAMSAR